MCPNRKFFWVEKLKNQKNGQNLLENFAIFFKGIFLFKKVLYVTYVIVNSV